MQQGKHGERREKSDESLSAFVAMHEYEKKWQQIFGIYCCTSRADTENARQNRKTEKQK